MSVCVKVYVCMRADVCMYIQPFVYLFCQPITPIQIDFYNALTHVQRGLLTLMLQNVVHAYDCICTIFTSMSRTV